MGQEEHSPPLSRLELRENEGCQHHSRTAASAPAGMGILTFAVEDFDPAVHMAAADVIPAALHKIQQDLLPHLSQISRDDPVHNPPVLCRNPQNFSGSYRWAAGAMQAPHIHGNPASPISTIFPGVIPEMRTLPPFLPRTKEPHPVTVQVVERGR